jgi:hypothetical protein
VVPILKSLEKDDETKFNETLKRMLKTPPKPHKPKSEKPKPRGESGKAPPSQAK